MNRAIIITLMGLYVCSLLSMESINKKLLQKLPKDANTVIISFLHPAESLLNILIDNPCSIRKKVLCDANLLTKLCMQQILELKQKIANKTAHKNYKKQLLTFTHELTGAFQGKKQAKYYSDNARFYCIKLFDNLSNALAKYHGTSLTLILIKKIDDNDWNQWQQFSEIDRRYDYFPTPSYLQSILSPFHSLNFYYSRRDNEKRYNSKIVKSQPINFNNKNEFKVMFQSISLFLLQLLLNYSLQRAIVNKYITNPTTDSCGITLFQYLFLLKKQIVTEIYYNIYKIPQPLLPYHYTISHIDANKQCIIHNLSAKTQFEFRTPNIGKTIARSNHDNYYCLISKDSLHTLIKFPYDYLESQISHKDQQGTHISKEGPFNSGYPDYMLKEMLKNNKALTSKQQLCSIQ